MVKKFRLARVAERLAPESKKKGPTLGIIQKGGQSGRSPNTLSYEQLGSCADSVKVNMEFARKKALNSHRTSTKSKGLVFRHVKNPPTSKQDDSRGS